MTALFAMTHVAHADPWPFVDRQLRGTMETVPANQYLHVATSAWALTSAGAWTSGFFPGTLWAMYARTADPVWRHEAHAQQAAIDGQKTRTDTHDLGFMFFPSFVNAYRLTAIDAYRQTALTAASSLDLRWQPTVGVIKTSWPASGTGEVKTIVDTLMNLELLFWGSASGGKVSWAQHAKSHALKTAAAHVRPDGSTYHVVTYSSATGAVRSKGTATYWATHVPADHVPPWDFEVPDPSSAPKDTSAAAITASGLLDLAQADPDPAYRNAALTLAQATLASLTATYLAQGTDNPTVLREGTQGRGGKFHAGLIYGDYYFLEALLKAQAMGLSFDAPPAEVVNLAVRGVTASSHDGNMPANTLDGKLSTHWSANGNGQ
jgi:unsaturated chondroitin disaccharide hydrolase